jgi:hypothetical protein
MVMWDDVDTQVPACKASAEVKGCLHRLLQLEHNPGVHGGRDSDVDGTHADEGPGNTRTKNAPCFLYLGTCLYAYVAGTVRQQSIKTTICQDRLGTTIDDSTTVD